MSFTRLLSKTLDSFQIDALVDQELSAILASIQPKLVYLFGSAANGTMTESSDLDFLVVCETEVELQKGKREYFSRDRPRHWPVDILFFTYDEFLKRSQIGGVAMVCLEKGKLLYGELT